LNKHSASKVSTLPVHNIDTGENFSTIHAAMDDAGTLNGHTITVDPGTYTENVNVYPFNASFVMRWSCEISWFFPPFANTITSSLFVPGHSRLSAPSTLHRNRNRNCHDDSNKQIPHVYRYLSFLFFQGLIHFIYTYTFIRFFHSFRNRLRQRFVLQY
jgi:hypothetical protein